MSVQRQPETPEEEFKRLAKRDFMKNLEGYPPRFREPGSLRRLLNSRKQQRKGEFRKSVHSSYLRDTSHLRDTETKPEKIPVPTRIGGSGLFRKPSHLRAVKSDATKDTATEPTAEPTTEATPDDSVTSKSESFEAIKPVQAKRSLSASLRNRVFKAFGKSGVKSSLPPQQMTATRQHFSEIEEPGTSSFDNYHVGQDDDRRESFYVPSRLDAEADEDRDRFCPTLHAVGSGESLQSNGRSRVTSWTNSSVASSTVRGPALAGNRLSIIKEDGGPHQPSSSAGRHLGGVNAFQNPLETENEDGQPYPPVDSQQIYSALMKRIGEEEVEMEQTEAALDEIHQRQYSDRDPFCVGKPTIRAVSATTLGTEAAGNHGDEDAHADPPHNIEVSAMDPAVHQGNLNRQKAKLASQEEQSSFYPFSDQGNPATPSPFRVLLEQRRREGLSDGHDENDLLDENQKPSKRLSRGRFGLSSESIYSQTTNGGENPKYIPPVASSEDLASVTQEVDEDTGMATIIPARYRSSERPKLPSADSSERREWKGWMKGEIDASLGRRDHSRTGVHYRGHAQIDPEDIQFSKGEAARPGSRAGQPGRFPLLDLKEVPIHNTPIPKRSSSLTRSQIGLLKRASVSALKSSSDRNDENKKINSGIRKLSPGNLANMLKEKKSQILMSKGGDVDKENKSANTDSPRSSSPPMSTPGRFGLQMRSGNGRLRKRASDMAFRSGQKQHVTRKNVSTPLEAKADNFEESPTDRVKQSLSARLSRPFNMDVPEPNRPFDSMFLGKQDLDFKNDRLSTAPNAANRKANGYGGLGPDPFDTDREDTALPQM